MLILAKLVSVLVTLLALAWLIIEGEGLSRTRIWILGVLAILAFLGPDQLALPGGLSSLICVLGSLLLEVLMLPLGLLGTIQTKRGGTAFLLLAMAITSAGLEFRVALAHHRCLVLMSHCLEVSEALDAFEQTNQRPYEVGRDGGDPFAAARTYARLNPMIPVDFDRKRSEGPGLALAFTWFSIGGDSWVIWNGGDWHTGDLVLWGPGDWGPYRARRKVGRQPSLPGIEESWLKGWTQEPSKDLAPPPAPTLDPEANEGLSYDECVEKYRGGLPSAVEIYCTPDRRPPRVPSAG